ncbi:hypothetical protein SDC9_135094 [bioreactor metagenome]|uniref:Uncharacterized protein n=1 Tax=bioreactor metagenome TaxID=1076179 RepID=A0A645DGP3_9ZZZZ
MTLSIPCALATRISVAIDTANASDENGLTTPEVPMMEIPPSIPSRGLKVFEAIRSPSGTEITTVAPAYSDLVCSPPNSSFKLCVIISKGVLLIAASPIFSPSPGRVTLPTPAPPKILTPGSFSGVTVAKIEIPFVISGSSPDSLIHSHVTELPSVL